MTVLTFPNFTPQRFATLQADAKAKGLDLAGNSGEVKRFGADIAYSYANATLTIQVKSAPHFHRLGPFCREIHDWVAATE